MRLTRGQIIGKIVLLLLALSSWGLMNFLEESEQSDSVQSNTGPEYFSRGYTRRVMDETGKLSELLVATAVNHQSQDDTTRLISPVLTLYKKESPPWVIRSETGTVPEGTKQVFLGGKVFIERDRTETLRPVKIITHDLTVNSEENFAETEAHVDIFSPPHKVSGDGMRTTLRDPIFMTLKSNVRGRYVLP